jgi:hypothetical protein
VAVLQLDILKRAGAVDWVNALWKFNLASARSRALAGFATRWLIKGMEKEDEEENSSLQPPRR